MITSILLLFLSLNSFASADCAGVDMNQLPDDKISEYTHCFKGAEVTTTETPKVKSKLKYTPVCDRSKPVKVELERIFENSCEQITKDMLDAYNGTFYLFGVTYRRPKIGDFSGMSNLKILSLLHSEIEIIPTGLFDDLENLQVLGLSHNNIKNLPINIFDKLVKLDELSLTSNAIKTLPISSFDNLTNLWHLSLRDNLIKELPMNIFDKLSKLTYLGLSFNQIKVLLNPILSNTENSLKKLNLDGNPLSHIYNSAFKNMTQLTSLYLQYTTLSVVGKNVFTPLESLMELDISRITTDNTLINEQTSKQSISLNNITLLQFTHQNPLPLKVVRISNSRSLIKNKNFIHQLVEKGVKVVN